MTSSVSHEAATLLEEALALPLPERSYLAERLLVSLDDGAEISAACREELDQRVKRRANGKSLSLEREEVKRRMQALLG